MEKVDSLGLMKLKTYDELEFKRKNGDEIFNCRQFSSKRIFDVKITSHQSNNEAWSRRSKGQQTRQMLPFSITWIFSMFCYSVISVLWRNFYWCEISRDTLS